MRKGAGLLYWEFNVRANRDLAHDKRSVVSGNEGSPMLIPINIHVHGCRLWVQVEPSAYVDDEFTSRTEKYQAQQIQQVLTAILGGQVHVVPSIKAIP